MEYIGFDYHKQFTFATSINKETGEVRQARLANSPEAINRFLKASSTSHAVLEASRTWPVFYNLLKGHVANITLAHPLKVKAIASARIKNDKIDSRILAELLAADLIPEAHIRQDDNRVKQAVLRQRAVLVSMRTRIKNRIHVLIDHQPYNVRRAVEGLSDLFGKAGIKWLREVAELSKNDRLLLDQMLVIYDSLTAEIAKSDKQVTLFFKDDPYAQLLATMPGIGTFLAVLISTEIDGIDRFPSAQKLASYTGLVPSTRGSANKFRHGKIIKEGNKWLRWAYVEATSRVKRTIPEFNRFYTPLMKRKGIRKATVALARRMVMISFSILREKRTFEINYEPSYC